LRRTSNMRGVNDERGKRVRGGPIGEKVRSATVGEWENGGSGWGGGGGRARVTQSGLARVRYVDEGDVDDGDFWPIGVERLDAKSSAIFLTRQELRQRTGAREEGGGWQHIHDEWGLV